MSTLNRPGAVRPLAFIVALAVFLCGSAAAAQQTEGDAPADDVPVDLELVLAVDVSGSMDDEEHRLQRSGYVRALAHPSVWTAIEAGAYRRIALMYLEWAGPRGQEIIIPWRLIERAEDLQLFSSDLADRPISFIRGTSISGALLFSARQFGGNGFEGFRRVIDVSGDGPNNLGNPIEPTRDFVAGQGITINGLPLMLRPSGSHSVRLADYYRDCVIAGPGAFVFPVLETAQVGEAIRRKLILEIADTGRAFPAMSAKGALTPVAASATDCMIGERLRRLWEEP